MSKAWKALGKHHAEICLLPKLSEAPGGRRTVCSKRWSPRWAQLLPLSLVLAQSCSQATVQGNHDKIVNAFFENFAQYSTGPKLSTWCKMLLWEPGHAAGRATQVRSGSISAHRNNVVLIRTNAHSPLFPAWKALYASQWRPRSLMA